MRRIIARDGSSKDGKYEMGIHPLLYFNEFYSNKHHSQSNLLRDSNFYPAYATVLRQRHKSPQNGDLCLSVRTISRPHSERLTPWAFFGLPFEELRSGLLPEC